MSVVALKLSDTKICLWCKEELSQSLFSKCRNSRDGLQSRCKKCDNEYNKKRRERIGKTEMRKKYNEYRKSRLNDFDYRISALWSASKQRAVANNREHSITKQDLKDLFPSDFRCPVFGFELEWGDAGFRETSPSIDRIDSTRGYTKDNVQIISWKANRIKSYATIDEIETVLNYMKSGG